MRSKATSLRFLPRQPARSVLSGRHASRLRGRGLNFEELRDYLPGDDVRTIDWKVTARTGTPYVRVYTEERDRPALLLVDQRMSMFFGSRLNMKSVTAAEAAALAAFRILDQGDRVGGIVFGDQTIAEFRPQRAGRAVNRLISAISTANQMLRADVPPAPVLPLNEPLAAAARIAKKDHLVIVFSDFDEIDDQTEALVRRLAMTNDVILFAITDPISRVLPEGLKLVVSDGDLQAEIDTRSGNVRSALADMTSGRLAQVLDWSKRFDVPVLPLSAGEPTLPQIQHLLGHKRSVQ
ncbi:MAG: DUF58 domain-containing protein [Pseudomonadota bacterium]